MDNKDFNIHKYQQIVNGLKNNEFHEITFITGAGLSTSAGIPDFRSQNGVFAKAKEKYGYQHPEQLFQLNSFLSNPLPFYNFCQELDMSKYLPTKAHLFQGFLCKKNVINTVFTQNVDGLEIKAGVPKEKIVFAHGNITEAACPMCQTNYDIKELNQHIKEQKIFNCTHCNNGFVKPKCIFYGERLPSDFFEKFSNINNSDLAFIMGSTLKVFPFANLPYNLPLNSWRVLINMERAGDTESERGFKFNEENNKDLFLQGKCDEMIEKLVKDVGWEEEFNKYCENRLSELNQGKS